MAGMFYSLKDVMAKMNKTEDEVTALVKQGRLREFRDGPNVLFKIEEVESLMSDTTFMAAQKPAAKPEDEEVELVIEGEEEKPKSNADTTAVASEGINVLGETDAEISLTDDTLAATRASGATAIIEGALSGSKPGTGEPSLEELEQNVNLDTFGSGSGLLDLSLQADDTSLGGILDEIYTPEGEEGKEAKEGSEIQLAAEADQLVEQPPVAAAEAMPAEEVTAGVAAAPALYIEPAPDTASGMLGIMLFVPLLAVVYAIVVAMAGQKEIASSVLVLKGLTWPIVGGAALITAVLSAMAFMGGGPKKPKAPKAPKVKKEKKSKKGKKGEEPIAEAPAEGTTAVAAVSGEVEAGADVAAVEEPLGAEEDLQLEDLDLSDVKDISDEADKL